MTKQTTTKDFLGKNYTPTGMGFAEGFMMAGLRVPRGNYLMVFSPRKARNLAKRLGLENIEEIEAGLDGDWYENSQVIYDGKWHKYEAWADSLWAEPIVLVKFKNRPLEAYACWSKKPLPEEVIK